MSTRSTIAIERRNGTRTGIYCHFDGYIEGVGVTLQLAYNTAEKVEELLKLGNISTLGYYTDSRDEKVNGTIAYHRDRGEKFVQSDEEQEYYYLFDEWDGVWYVSCPKWIKDTPATEAFGLEFMGKERKLLLDALYEVDWDKIQWQDDEFAKNGEVLDRCIEKALEGREDAE